MTTGLTPYITPKVLLATNYGVDWKSFPRQGASSEDQLAAQLDACWKATSEADAVANQSLRAGVDTETEFGPDLAVTVPGNGWARMRMTRSPVLRVVGAAAGPAAATPPVALSPIPATSLVVEHGGQHQTGTIVPAGGSPSPTTILVAPGYVSWALGRNGYMLQVTTVSGFPVAGIDAAAAAGDTEIHVDDVSGWWDPDQGLGAAGTVADPPTREDVSVSGMTPDVPGAISGPGTLTLAAPLQFPHVPLVGGLTGPDQRVLLTAMPQTLQNAVLYFATYFGLMRGSAALAPQQARGAIGGVARQDWYERGEKAVARFARTW